MIEQQSSLKPNVLDKGVRSAILIVETLSTSASATFLDFLIHRNGTPTESGIFATGILVGATLTLALATIISEGDRQAAGARMPSSREYLMLASYFLPVRASENVQQRLRNRG